MKQLLIDMLEVKEELSNIWDDFWEGEMKKKRILPKKVKQVKKQERKGVRRYEDRILNK